MDFILTDPRFHPLLLSLWCTLNTSYGGTFLGFVGVAGIGSVGGRLLFGLPNPEAATIAQEYKQGRRRQRTIWLGAITLAFLFATVVLFIISADGLRGLGPTCEISKASSFGIKSLHFFYVLAIVSTILLT
jgi:hypothetical protein